MRPVCKAFSVLLLLLIFGLIYSAVAVASTYTRDGGTADWMCCTDRACTQIIEQKADAVRARDACGALVDQDGVKRYVRSQAFRIEATLAPPPASPGSVQLSWTPPTQNIDGSALTDLAGYWVAYGQAPDALNLMLAVTNASASSHVIESLGAGTWYFAMRSYNAAGTESAASSAASVVLP